MNETDVLRAFAHAHDEVDQVLLVGMCRVAGYRVDAGLDVEPMQNGDTILNCNELSIVSLSLSL